MKSDSALSIRDRLLALADRDKPIDRLFVRLGVCTIELGSKCGELLERLRPFVRAFATEHVTSPDISVLAVESQPLLFDVNWTPFITSKGKDRIKEDYLDLPDGRIVRKRQTGLLFFFDRQRSLVAGPCLENSSQVIKFINGLYIQWMLDRGALLCHASAVSLGDRGFAVAGPSSAGKSTLALKMVGRGLCFVSNDRLLIKREAEGPMLYGALGHARVNPGTLLADPVLTKLLRDDEKNRVRSLDLDDLWRLESKHDVLIDRVYGPGRSSTIGRLSGLMILNWRRGGSATSFNLVDPSLRPDLLEMVLKPPGVFFLNDPCRDYDFSLRAYSKLLEEIPVIEATGDVSFERAAEMGLDLLRED